MLMSSMILMLLLGVYTVCNAVMRNAVIQGTAPLFTDPVLLTQPSNVTYLKFNDEFQTFIMVRGCEASLSMKIASCYLVHPNSSNCSNITCHTQLECFNSIKMISFKIEFNQRNLIGLNIINADNSSSLAVQTTVSFCHTRSMITSCGRTAQLFISGLPLAATEDQVTSTTPYQSASTTAEPAKIPAMSPGFSFEGPTTNSYKSFHTYPLGMYASFSMLVFSTNIAVT